ncbi:MAG: RNA-binding protein S1 [Thermobacillus sp. ZCTH02-B1]|uniref:S1 domain-containing RNA-binding protein n=1 Tax=Thermobacillus sp. ZCTH02-B1 TaxID=1858795 RepID=UPI000B55F3CC|nr:S1 domain-containing RNA-binding protein [Thermobacillus sp. ZCTH02-B1]OUM95532.1 MAG: RNA-binding protein S1 [Thermobacillus sp. ZCTH02-B1]
MAIEVGAKLEGRVTGITRFGAFIDLADGVTGLVHISEIADHYVRDVNDYLKIDDIVTVKVIRVDKDGKIALSIRQAVDRPAGRVPSQRGDRRPGGRGGVGPASGKLSFEEKISRFLRDSEERIASLRRNAEGKRGGRGARRG